MFDSFMKQLFWVVNYLVGDSIVQHLNNEVFVDLKYKLYGNNYIYRLYLNNDPMIIRNLYVTDENGEDVTERVVKYMGPNYDFHGVDMTPEILGYKSLNIHEQTYSKIFRDNDIIILN